MAIGCPSPQEQRNSTTGPPQAAKPFDVQYATVRLDFLDDAVPFREGLVGPLSEVMLSERA
jgi:hypothetical protein